MSSTGSLYYDDDDDDDVVSEDEDVALEPEYILQQYLLSSLSSLNKKNDWRTRDSMYSILSSSSIQDDDNRQEELSNNYQSFHPNDLDCNIIQLAFTAAATTILLSSNHDDDTTSTHIPTSIQSKQEDDEEEEESFIPKSSTSTTTTTLQKEEEKKNKKLFEPNLIKILNEIQITKDNSIQRIQSLTSGVHKKSSSSTTTTTTTTNSTNASKKRGSSNPTTTASGTKKSKKQEKKSNESGTSNTNATTKSGTSLIAGVSNIDSRATVSRAILCAAASVTFSSTTPGPLLDGLQVPQNTHLHNSQNEDNSKNNNDDDDDAPIINMGAVMMQADIFGKRAIELTTSTARRSDIRRQWRCDSYYSNLHNPNIHILSRSQRTTTTVNKISQFPFLKLQNPHYLPPSSSSTTKTTTPTSHFISEDDDNNDDDTEEDDDDDASDNNNNNNNKCNKQQTAVNENDDDNEDYTLYMFDNERTATKQDDLSNDNEWMNQCRPSLLKILKTGAGHAIWQDLQWNTRYERISDLLYHHSTTTNRNNGGGPHLIITSSCELQEYANVFDPSQHISIHSSTMCSKSGRLRALIYGQKDEKIRRIVRKNCFPALQQSGGGSRKNELPQSVIVTSLTIFLQDYVHFCQIPFGIVILDDGLSWLGTAHYDPNGQIGKLWDSCLWSKSDLHSGMAGTTPWNFDTPSHPTTCTTSSRMKKTNSNSKTNSSSTTANNKSEKSSSSTTHTSGDEGVVLWMGLTARNKIVTGRRFHVNFRDVTYTAPVPAMVSFVLPHFADVVREEWDRSRIHNCKSSMNHIRTLLSRSIVVYTGLLENNNDTSICSSSDVSLASLQGRLAEILSISEEDLYDLIHTYHSIEEREVISTDLLVVDGKIIQSRRFAASWLHLQSPIRYELGSCDFSITCPKYLWNVISTTSNTTSGSNNSTSKTNKSSGSSKEYVCEEVVTASSLTSSGAGGAVTGPAAYQYAIRCGRCFGSEQGLRQHMAALHAPPGTWLCRSCGGDCGTSQARTHHERYCGQNQQNQQMPSSQQQTTTNPHGGSIPTVGQGTTSGGISSSNNNSSNNSNNTADVDGSIRVPGYRGVWVNPTGKHFIKIQNKPLTLQDYHTFYPNKANSSSASNSSGRWLLKSAEEAAKYHDEICKKKGLSGDKVELNYKSDGKTRKVYEDTMTAHPGRGLEMLGGGASSVVPALSVINIKDLPSGVKPLLRDPRQTSRTGSSSGSGGNKQRHVYAYRGVCRQARKGHDRWQSQISFGGTNHYLGTFDSEWDAAAIYAWAHLILYGEEATKKAQVEGEEAVASYEQEKKDIANGIIPPPDTKKQKKTASSTKKTKSSATSTATSAKKKKSTTTTNTAVEKKSNFVGIPKIPFLYYNNTKGTRQDLLWGSSQRILSTRNLRTQGRLPPMNNKKQSSSLPLKCISIPVDDDDDDDDDDGDTANDKPMGVAMLVGLVASQYGWTVESFLHKLKQHQISSSITRSQEELLQSEYGTNDNGGINPLFQCVLQSLPCRLGRASSYMERASASMGLHGAELGGTVGHLDCNVGGYNCSEIAACINTNYELSVLTPHDIITLNGRRLPYNHHNKKQYQYPLSHKDIISIGSRVFVFILPKHKTT